MTQSDKFRKVKQDATPYLFHFTKGESAINTLSKILEEETLISAKKPYICFTSSPLTSLKKFFQTKVNRTGLPMYMPYGIGFSRDIMYQYYGARNVIYSTKEEIEEIGKIYPQLLWRCEELDIQNHDFEYLKEWRIRLDKFDFHDFDKEHIIIIAKSKKELDELAVAYDWDVEFEYEHEIRSAYPIITRESNGKRKWKGIAIDDADSFLNDFEISALTKTQIIGEELLPPSNS